MMTLLFRLMAALGIVWAVLLSGIHPASAQNSGRVGISVQGFTEPYYDVELGLPDAGRIAEIKVEEGLLVNKGDVLLNLDKELQELEAARGKAKVKSRAELIYAQKRVGLLQRQCDSAQSLFKDGAASREDLETKQLDLAEASSEAARLQMEEQLEKIELDLAEEKLRRRILRAPFQGVVADIMKDPGESVQAQEPLIRLVDAARGRFVGSAEGTVGKHLAPGQEVCLNFENSGLPPIPARITFLSPTIDTASGLMEIKAEFNNEKAMVRLGGAAELFTTESGRCSEKP